MFNVIFFLIVDMCLICKNTARQTCVMVPRWRILYDFLRPVFLAGRVQHIFRPAVYIRTKATPCMKVW